MLLFVVHIVVHIVHINCISDPVLFDLFLIGIGCHQPAIYANQEKEELVEMPCKAIENRH